MLSYLLILDYLFTDLRVDHGLSDGSVRGNRQINT